MALITWTEDFSVGVVEIDNQHKKLVNMINELHHAMAEGKGNMNVGDIINRLVDYSVYHFKTEEKYFDKFNYPETEAHKKIHSDFVKKVSIFKGEFDNNEVMLTIDVLNFLSNWLREHILGEDMDYSDFFIENGLK